MIQSVDVFTISHDELAPSPLNPRKHFDADGITELANSIARDGQVYQNLIARKADGLKVGKGKAAREVSYEIIAGERRWRAVRQIMEGKDWPVGKPFPMPVRVIEADDAKVVELATIENLQRKNLTPLEEGRAFADMRKYGRETDQIAEAMSMSRRYIQIRLALVDKLSKKCQAALDDGSINIVQARTLTMGSKARQDEIIDVVVRGGYMAAEQQIKHSLVGDLPTVANAIFDVALYDGSWIDDPDGDDGDRRFADRGKFEQLQKAALDALEKTLGETWAWVKVVDGYASTYMYEKSKNRKKAGAIIQVVSLDNITVYDGLIKPAEQAKEGETPKPQPVFTKAHLTYAANRKTEALQDAVAADVRTAKIMTCLALMGERETARFGCDHINPDDRAISPDLLAAAKALGSKLKAVAFDTYGRGLLNLKRELTGKPDLSAHKAYEAIKALSDADLDRLFSALVAAQVGTFAGADPTLGDSSLAVQLAEDLNVNTGARWSIDDDYLALCKKPSLIDILGANGEWTDGGASAQKKTAKALREMVRTETSGTTHILPRELQFGSPEDLEKAKPVVTQVEGVASKKAA